MAETTSRSLTLDSRDEAVLLFGNRDQYLKLLRDALGVRVRDLPLTPQRIRAAVAAV